jgi:hypothetical protein
LPSKQLIAVLANSQLQVQCLKKRPLHRDSSSLWRKTEEDHYPSMLNAVMRPCHQMMQANSLRNPREAEASTNMEDSTLSPNSRELEDGEVVDITKLTPDSHGITQGIEIVLGTDHVSPSMVNDDEPPLEQARAATH